MMDPTIPWFADRLKGMKRTGTGFQCRCPSHTDKTPSLRINRGTKGWLFRCYKGCTFSDIMGALDLPLNAAFYDYDVPVSTLSRDTDTIFREWIGETPTWCRKSHTLEDVAWETYPQEARTLAQANAEVHPWAGMMFEDAMRMWLTSGQVWLGYWLSERWMMQGGWHKIGWTDFSKWMSDQMWATYLSTGCSGSTCGESPSPAPSLTAEQYLARHTTLPSTHSGSTT